jgi:spore coat polysaccharide biosynthesis protein SpsF
MKIIATIEARMRSTRLPGKVMKKIMGKPMLALMIERLQRARQIDGIVIATTVDPSCDPIEELASQLGVGCYRGSEDDVLDRVLQAAIAFEGDIIVETTGDCPLIDPALVDRVIDIYMESKFDYVANGLRKTFPVGFDVQVFSTATLRKVAQLTIDPSDHEHVSLYIYKHPELFSLYNVESGLPEKYWNLRLTVDAEEDFNLVKTIFEELYPEKPAFTLYDVLDLLDRKPDLLEINQHIQQKVVL